MNDTTDLLRLENIHKSYEMGTDIVPVLRGVNLSLRQGEFVAIMGASGSGKSTLLHIAGALDRPDTAPRNGRADRAGEVYFRGTPVSQMSLGARHRLRNREFGFVFQFYHLLPELNVLENVLLPSMVESTPRWLLYGPGIPGCGLLLAGLLALLGSLVGGSPPLVFLLGLLLMASGALIILATCLAILAFHSYQYFIRRTARKHEALRLIEAFGLKDRIRHRPGQLSGGERQRVAIARALINNPALLLADEPTGNLDAKTGRGILDVLVRLHRERGQTMLLVTHDPNVAKLADRTVQLVEGKIRQG